MPNDAPQGYVVLGLAAASLAVWSIVVRRVASGRQIVPYEPRRPVPWDGGHVVAIAVVFLAMQVAMGLVLHLSEQQAVASEQSKASEPAEAAAESPADQAADESLMLLTAASAANLLAFAFAFLLLRYGAEADFADLGIVPRRAAGDVVLGVAGFAAASVPVLVIQQVLMQYVEYVHPVVDIFGGQPRAWAIWLTAAFAVVVAPLTEEFFFRVVLQGWLERRLGARVPEAQPAIVAGPSPLGDALPPIDEAPPLPTVLPNVVGPVAPALCDAEAEQVAGFDGVTDERRSAAAVVPIVVSSGAFALMHLGSGASAVPLFFYALVLGYLYRQTHRLLPVVVMHAALNLFSVAMLWAAAE